MSVVDRKGTWQRTTLGEVTCVVRGRLNPQDRPELPFIGMDNVEAHTMRLLGTVPAMSMKSASVHFQPGDVLYGRLRPYLNKVLAPDFEGLASAEFIPLTMPAGVSHKFIQYRMNAADFVAYASRLDEGDRPRVDYDQIGAFLLDLPPTAEQHRIVEAIESHFSRLDDAMATLVRVQHSLKRYRASVLEAAVEGRLVRTEAELAQAESRHYEPAAVLLERILAERRKRWEEAELAAMKAQRRVPRDDQWKSKYQQPAAPDTTGLPQLPDGWCWASIDQLGDVTGGLTQNANRRQLSLQLPFLRVANVYANELRLDGVKSIGVTEAEIERARLRAGDLLVVEGNGSVDQIGRVALWNGSIDPCLHQNHLIKVRFALRELADWCLVWLLSPAGRVTIQQTASSTSGLHTLSLSKVGRLPCPLAPLAEQRRVVAAVERQTTIGSAVATDVASGTQRALRLRQSILKWAFEGSLVDQHHDDEPASALLERIRSTLQSLTQGTPRSGGRRRGATQRA